MAELAHANEDAGEFLAHYGKLGMKWGKHRNAGYSDNQIERDRQIYGAGGAKRINEHLNNGHSISVARGAEKTRRDSVLGKNKYARQGGKVGGAVLGGAAALVATHYAKKALESPAGHAATTKLLGQLGGNLAYTIVANPIIRGVAVGAAGKVGSMAFGDAAVSINTRSHGYDPRRKP